MLYKLGLKVTGLRLYFGCILVVCWLQYNVVTTFLGVYIFTLSQRSFTTLSQPKHNVVTTLSQRKIVCWVGLPAVSNIASVIFLNCSNLFYMLNSHYRKPCIIYTTNYCIIIYIYTIRPNYLAYSDLSNAL